MTLGDNNRVLCSPYNLFSKGDTMLAVLVFILTLCIFNHTESRHFVIKTRSHWPSHSSQNEGRLLSTSWPHDEVDSHVDLTLICTRCSCQWPLSPCSMNQSCWGDSAERLNYHLIPLREAKWFVAGTLGDKHWSLLLASGFYNWQQ